MGTLGRRGGGALRRLFDWLSRDIERSERNSKKYERISFGIRWRGATRRKLDYRFDPTRREAWSDLLKAESCCSFNGFPSISLDSIDFRLISEWVISWTTKERRSYRIRRRKMKGKEKKNKETPSTLAIRSFPTRVLPPFSLFRLDFSRRVLPCLVFRWDVLQCTCHMWRYRLI